MKEYFQLQFELMKRQFQEMGFNPIFALTLLTIGFGVFSWLLFQKSGYAPYIYSSIAIILVASLSNSKRTEFLKITFKNTIWKRIRIIENLIVVTPFTVVLCLKLEFISVLLLVGTTCLMAIFTFKATFTASLPTPFSKRPFEFTIGFRNTIFLYIIIYGLAIVAVAVTNFNLGIFALLCVFAVTMSYYSKPEDEWFVWNYALNPKEFLLKKIKTGLLQTSLLLAPITIMLSVFYISNIHYILLFLIAGYSFVISMITAKYAAYPNEMNLIEGILIALSVAFPPLLLIIVPYFFNKSTKNLKTILQ